MGWIGRVLLRGPNSGALNMESNITMNKQTSQVIYLAEWLIEPKYRNWLDHRGAICRSVMGYAPLIYNT